MAIGPLLLKHLAKLWTRAPSRIRAALVTGRSILGSAIVALALLLVVMTVQGRRLAQILAPLPLRLKLARPPLHLTIILARRFCFRRRTIRKPLYLHLLFYKLRKEFVILFR